MEWVGVGVVVATLAFGFVFWHNFGGLIHGRSDERMESDREHYLDPDPPGG